MFYRCINKAIALILGWGQDNSWPADLLTPEQTRKALARERNRAERTGTELSVVSFHAPGPDGGRPALLALVEVLLARLRTSDEVGRRSEHEVCALLLATPSENARKAIERVFDQLPAGITRPSYTVSSYGNNQPSQQEMIPDDSPSTVGIL